MGESRACIVALWSTHGSLGRPLDWMVGSSQPAPGIPCLWLQGACGSVACARFVDPFVGVRTVRSRLWCARSLFGARPFGVLGGWSGGGRSGGCRGVGRGAGACLGLASRRVVVGCCISHALTVEGPQRVIPHHTKLRELSPKLRELSPLRRCRRRSPWFLWSRGSEVCDARTLTGTYPDTMSMCPSRFEPC